jgi:HSP20 family protein
MAQQWNWMQGTMVPALPSPQQLPANIYETAGGEAYVIEIPVPSLKPDEIVIEATVDSLTVATEPQQAEADANRRYIQHEQPIRPLSRLFEFPVEIDTDNVRPTLEKGMLKIYVPKAAASRPKVIRVGVADQPAAS